MKRGIFLVANLQSQEMCENLVYSIRNSGCSLPIRIIHFGGKEISSNYLLGQAELLYFKNFPAEAKQFIRNLRSVLTDCPMGFIYRFLALYSDWDEFIYSDNDVVALCNWEKLFTYLDGYDLVHADEEYITKGVFNYFKPEKIKEIFGEDSLETAITAGHIVVRKDSRIIEDVNQAVTWFKENPSIPKKHDQSLLHVASLLGNWKVLNLCKAPHNWLSSWAGDYKNSLQVIQLLQNNNTNISHIHYSGGKPLGNLAIEDFLFSKLSNTERIKRIVMIGVYYLSKLYELKRQFKRTKKFIKRKLV